jgi:SAM-dependent methyltransferase
MSVLPGLQYRFLRAFFPEPPRVCEGTAYRTTSKLEVLIGPDLLKAVKGKTVIDFGCGEGREALELVQWGAEKVVGIDIRDDLLAKARARAQAEGVSTRCEFVTCYQSVADFIISIDSFEHFADPAGVLLEMDRLLKPDGQVIVCFGPTWYHPLGGHLFSVFPWAHLIFCEEALIKWRSHFKDDGATRFSEVAGGLNQMTIRRFEKLVKESPFVFSMLELVPIRKLRWLHCGLTREFTTSMVRCCLVKKGTVSGKVATCQQESPTK